MYCDLNVRQHSIDNGWQNATRIVQFEDARKPNTFLRFQGFYNHFRAAIIYMTRFFAICQGCRLNYQLRLVMPAPSRYPDSLVPRLNF